MSLYKGRFSVQSTNMAARGPVAKPGVNASFVTTLQALTHNKQSWSELPVVAVAFTVSPSRLPAAKQLLRTTDWELTEHTLSLQLCILCRL